MDSKAAAKAVPKLEYGDELFIYAMVLLEEMEEMKRVQEAGMDDCIETVINSGVYTDLD